MTAWFATARSDQIESPRFLPHNSLAAAPLFAGRSMDATSPPLLVASIALEVVSAVTPKPAKEQLVQFSD